MATEGTDPSPPEALDKVREIINRAKSGDLTVVPALRDLLARHAPVWQRHGDLAAQVELSWITLAAGPDLLLRESTVLYAAKLRAELTRPAASPIEKLLVERAVATWLQLNYFSGVEAADLGGTPSPVVQQLRAKRQAQAQRMHERALAALLTVQKLLPAVPVEVAVPVEAHMPAEVESRPRAGTERAPVFVEVADPVETDTEAPSAERIRVSVAG